MSLYAWLMVLSFAGPFALSFDKKVAFYKTWKLLFPGILLNALIFLSWDIWFTWKGVWGFSTLYTFPQRWFLLPIEEWSFFLVIPYASVFIYACLEAYFDLSFFKKAGNVISILALLALALVIAVWWDRTYTLVNSAVALVLLAHQFFIKKSKWMHAFWLAYLVHLIPFLLVNGVLTGFVTPEPVVWYNTSEIIGFRLGTIPVEDTIYAFSCLYIPIAVKEWLNARQG
ncbi:MAG: lycopene cyclase domain-containing protein [Bacteroidetes bacterium]|nr:lycopene cyclase domain-containing protein [Bacteroidota bacterium]